MTVDILSDRGEGTKIWKRNFHLHFVEYWCILYLWHHNDAVRGGLIPEEQHTGHPMYISQCINTPTNISVGVITPMMWTREVHNSAHPIHAGTAWSLQVAHVSGNSFSCQSGIVAGLMGEMWRDVMWRWKEPEVLLDVYSLSSAAAAFSSSWWTLCAAGRQS